MRKLACWAAQHPWTARFLIVFLYLPLNIAGVVLGDLLFDLGVVFPPYILYTACFIALAAIAYYPSRRYPVYIKNFFLKRKVADFLLLFSTVCMITFTGNQLNSPQTYSLITPAGGIPSINSHSFIGIASVQPTKPAGKTVTKKQLRKKVVSLLKSMRKKYKDMPDGVKILYILLAAVVIFVTLYLILALACSISCGGLQTIGYLALLLGIGLGIFVTILIFKRLSRNHPKNREIKPPPSERT